MKKRDAIVSAVLGFLIGVCIFIVSKNIEELKLPFSPAVFIVILPPLSVLGMLVASWLGKKFLFIIQVAKFALVGALNTLIDLGVLYSLIGYTGVAEGTPFSFFKGLSFLTATVNSYFWNKFWTFQKTEGGVKVSEFSKFIVATGIGFLLNVAVASFVVNIIGPQFGLSEKIWAGIGAMTATLIAMAWNFMSSKFLVFKK